MENFRDLSDQELLLKFQNGSDRAFEEIHNRYFGRLYMHAIKMLRDEDASQDVVQDVFISFWTKRSNLKVHTSLAAYLFTSIRNRVLNAIAQDGVYNDHIQSFTEFREQSSQNHTIQTSEEETLFQLFEEGVKGLPPKMKEIFELRRHEELSYKEIAERLSLSDKTVKKQINNAIKLLKNRLMGWNTDLAVVAVFIAW